MAKGYLLCVWMKMSLESWFVRDWVRLETGSLETNRADPYPRTSLFKPLEYESMNVD